MTKGYLFFGFIFCLAGNLYAQDKISLKEAKEINYQAKLTIKGLQDLLNYIAFKGNPPSELQDIINNSFDPASRNRTFDNKDITIEDDIDPSAKLGSSVDASAQKYLTDLDLKYEKTTEPSISLTNLKFSSIKKKNYIYIKVKFDSQFGNKYILKKSTYPVRQREAQIKVENAGSNNWNATIVSINFYNPDISVDSLEKNNMLVTADSTVGSGIVTQAELDKQQAAYDLAKAAEEKKKEADFQEYLKEGSNYVAAKNYKDGLLMFAKAKTLRPLVPSLDKAILDGKRDSADYTYDKFKNKGDNAQNERRFNDAIKFYKKAIELNPDASSKIQPLIDDIEKKVAVFSSPYNYLQAGNAKDAISECERILDLSENRKSKKDFPELYYLEALAYQKLLESNFDNSDLKQKAFENFKLAILYFPNYTEAHKARASFLVRYKGDLINAITDYDQLTTNASDNAPEKPVYFVQKAKWKDVLGNYPGAIDDYASAIALNPKADSIYYDRGELLYRMRKFDEAKKSLDSAIELNLQNNQAFYVRGLSYLGLNDNYKAGLDFVDAQRLGISQDELDTIDNKSNKYYYSALDSVGKHNFTSADILFDNALKIKSCNALALLGKADIRFTIGEERKDKNQLANAKKSYLESIEYCKMALKCDTNYSNAFCKEGLAEERIGEYDLAFQNFSGAIRSDKSNIQAYIERGNLQQQLKKYDKAEDDYTQALNHLQISYDLAKKDNFKDKVKHIDTLQSEVNQLDGQAFYYLNNYSSALAALNNALDKNGNNSEAFYYRGLVYYAQNEFSKSITDFDQALKIMPLCKYYFVDGNANFKNKNYTTATDYLGFVIQSDTLKDDFKNKYYLQGLSFFKNNLVNKSNTINAALVDFDTYNRSEASKTDTGFFADYGMVELFAGKYDDAFKNFNQALSLSAANSKALFGLGCYYAITGKFDKVLDFMQQAFSKNGFSKDDIKPYEEVLLVDFNKIKVNRVKYEQLKKQYFTN